MIKNLTEGKPSEVLWKFTLPMLISVVFQQLYNIADSVIAGRFAGEAALAAVGASYPVTMIFMAVAVGSNIGCSVVISQLFGAGEYVKLKTAVTTTVITAVVISVLLTGAGLAFSSDIMRLINTPEDIFESSSLYFRIYILGFIFLFLYNIANGVFNSLGDSKTPLYFLIGSSVGNILLDIIFVIKFNWGVAGVAWATFIAQGTACVLSAISLVHRLAQLKTRVRNIYFSIHMLRRISAIAVPSILQQSFLSVGNIFIQGLVNSFGSAVIAGYSAAIKLNTFTTTAMTTLGNGMSNFTAQNLGAGMHERVRSGLKAGIVFSMIVTSVFFVAFFFFSSEMIGIFMKNGTSEAMDCGVEFLRTVSPFYFVVSLKLVVDGVLRGGGDMRAFMAGTFTDLILRVVLSFVFAALLNSSFGIWLSWPFGWTIATCVSVYFYFRGRWKNLL